MLSEPGIPASKVCGYERLLEGCCDISAFQKTGAAHSYHASSVGNPPGLLIDI
jgi:hypothetical protein